MSLTIICSVCGKKRYVKNRKKKPRYCSQKCYWSTLNGKIPPNKNKTTILCAQCGEKKSISPSAVRIKNFCNIECRSAYYRVAYAGSGHPQYKGNKPTAPCKQCGAPRSEWKSKQRGKYFCSTRCSAIWTGKRHRGKNHHRYKGGPKAEKLRRLSNPRNLINHRMSKLVRATMKRHLGSSNKAGKSWTEIFGYPIDELFQRLQATMPEGYTWEDFRSGKLHIDHIRAVSRFNFSSIEDPEFKRCWALKNLQLLPWLENIRKWNHTPRQWAAMKRVSA